MVNFPELASLCMTVPGEAISAREEQRNHSLAPQCLTSCEEVS